MIFLIQGEIGVGKSTLLRNLAAHFDLKPAGFLTEKVSEDDGGFSVYLHPLNRPRQYTPERIVGERRPGQKRQPRTAAFEAAAEWIGEIPAGQVVLLDELGFLEEEALQFQEAVRALLLRSSLALVAIKPAHTPFLDSIRALPRAQLHTITPENREELLQLLVSAKGEFAAETLTNQNVGV